MSFTIRDILALEISCLLAYHNVKDLPKFKLGSNEYSFHNKAYHVSDRIDKLLHKCNPLGQLFLNRSVSNSVAGLLHYIKDIKKVKANRYTIERNIPLDDTDVYNLRIFEQYIGSIISYNIYNQGRVFNNHKELSGR